MKKRLGWAGVLFAVGLCIGSASGSEPACYATEDAAAQQVGVRGVEGYRLESLRRDVFSGAWWATVRSCQHPEQPARLVLAGRTGAAHGDVLNATSVSVAAPAERPMAVLAGRRVLAVEVGAMARLEMSAIAQSSGRVGDRIRLRLLAISDVGADSAGSWSAPERFAVGVIRSSEVVEMEAQ
jgi:hypothetical protein